MKRVIIILSLFVLLALNVNAQRVNKYGQKMVSQIEYFQEKRSRLFTFIYDENDELIRMSVYHKFLYDEKGIAWLNRISRKERNEQLESFPMEYKLYRDFKKDDRGLVVKDYHTYNYSPLRWEVEFDTYGNICRISNFEEYSPGSIKKDEFNFYYERNDIDNTFRLCMYNHTEMGKHKGEESWSGTSIGTSNINIFFYDGFIMTETSSDLSRIAQYKNMIDFEHKNDTNVNLLYFMSTYGKLYPGGVYMEYFTLPEWLHCISKYFVKNKENYYDYDEQGNLTIFGQGKTKSPKDCYDYRVEIKYVY